MGNSSPIKEIKQALSDAAEGHIPASEIVLTPPPAHLAETADMASDLGFQMAKRVKGKAPLVYAQEIAQRVKGDWLEAASAQAPGYVNVRLTSKALGAILASGTHFDFKNQGLPVSVLLEYCSANPTGPLHLGHPRGAILGDTLSRIFSYMGVGVHREFYINDEGSRMEKVGASLKARFENIPVPEDGYPGEYLAELAQNLPKEAVSWSLAEFSDAAKIHILGLIRKDLEAMDVSFDRYFPESDLHKAGAVLGVIEELQKRGCAAEEEGAIFFKTQSEDDKDRVLRKSSGQPTYFASDLAYHQDKFKRPFERYINIWGADHHGYVPRMKLGMEALGLDASKFHAILVQMVRLTRDGKPVKLSKRAGDYEPLAEVVGEVGRDALRFFMNSRTPNTQLDFDLDLAKKQSSENPVYLIQYAHARICSITREKAVRKINWPETDFIESDLKSRTLIVALGMFPDALLACAKHLSGHPLTNYLQDLARYFHAYYETHPILGETDPRLAFARYHLCLATQKVLAQGLSLLGISAPEKM